MVPHGGGLILERCPATTLSYVTVLTYATDAVRITGSNATLDHCTIIARSGHNGVNAYSSTVAIRNSVVSGASFAVRVEESEATITNSRIEDRGVACYDGSLVMTNCVIDRPTSAAISLQASSASMSNCTIYGSGGVAAYGAYVPALSTLNLRNSIVCGNEGGDLQDPGGGTISVAYSNIGGSGLWPGEGNINAGPMFADAANGDYTLPPGSPCIDAGDPLTPLDPDGTRADMGAWLPSVGPTGVGAAPAPGAFELRQNAPNPFNPSTTIRFTVPQSGNVNIAIYDATGRHVRTLVDGHIDAGYHEVVWDGTDALGRQVSSGVYLCRLARTRADEAAANAEHSNTDPNSVRVRRMLLVR